jgi:hypothetical protein
LSFSRSGFLVCWKLFQLKVRRWLQVLGAAVRFEEDVVVALLEFANKDLLLEQVSRSWLDAPGVGPSSLGEPVQGGSGHTGSGRGRGVRSSSPVACGRAKRLQVIQAQLEGWYGSYVLLSHDIGPRRAQHKELGLGDPEFGRRT